MMQPFCLGLSHVMRAGFTVITLRQRNNRPTGLRPKEPYQDQEKVSQVKSKVQISRILVYKEFVSASQTVNATFSYCDILQ